MASFKVVRTGCSGDDMKYEYECATVATTGTATRSTGCNQMHGKELQYLDRHNVQCEAGEVMASFKVVRTGCSGDDMKYEYECATVAATAGLPDADGDGTPDAS